MKNNTWKWCKIITCILALAILGLSITIYIKINKQDKKPKTSIKRDMGPVATTGTHPSSPPSPIFVSKCRKTFDNMDSNATLNVCGDDKSVGVQDYTDMNDFTCTGAPYVAYTKTDCINPYVGTRGYLCGGPKCPTQIGPKIQIIDKAGPNPYGCTHICQ